MRTRTNERSGLRRVLLAAAFSLLVVIPSGAKAQAYGNDTYSQISNILSLLNSGSSTLRSIAPNVGYGGQQYGGYQQPYYGNGYQQPYYGAGGYQQPYYGGGYGQTVQPQQRGVAYVNGVPAIVQRRQDGAYDAFDQRTGSYMGVVAIQ
jgi:hypothetical protein